MPTRRTFLTGLLLAPLGRAWAGFAAAPPGAYPRRDFARSLKRYGWLERPQLLLRQGRPAYLFCASQGGAAGTASPFVLRVGQRQKLF